MIVFPTKRKLPGPYVICYVLQQKVYCNSRRCTTIANFSNLIFTEEYMYDVRGTNYY